jgi:hypothetical protein
MDPTGCPETSVTNYQSTLHKIPEELRSNLQGGGSVKLLMIKDFKVNNDRELGCQ